ncbi:MAG: twin-arginine translocation signal domain-containing protein, partial [Thermoleophilia bacterium]|nr:twin-arginine translocation signal domain-containing protein [Thermoleophilia bacterium]
MSKPLNRRQFLEGSGGAAAASLLAAGVAHAQTMSPAAAINQAFLFEGK